MPASRHSARNQTRRPAQPAACAPATGPTTTPAAAPAAGPSANGRPPIVDAPGTKEFVKLGPVTVITVRAGELRVAIDYTGPAPTVYALVAAAAAVLAEREAAA